MARPLVWDSRDLDSVSELGIVLWSWTDHLICLVFSSSVVWKEYLNRDKIFQRAG